MAEDELHAHVERGLDRAPAAQLGIEAEFQPRDAFAVGIGDADDLRRHAPVGVIALAVGLVFEARQAEALDLGGSSGESWRATSTVPMLAGEQLRQPALVGPGGGRQFVRGERACS